MANSSPRRVLIRSGILLTTIALLFWLFNSLTRFEVQSIEIKNVCKVENDHGGSCKRSFDPSEYFNKVEEGFKAIFNSPTILQKLAGAEPLLFSYKVGYEDLSYARIIGTTKNLTFVHGSCPFPAGFKAYSGGGEFEESISLSEIPGKLKELSISLNDCQQPLQLIPKDPAIEPGREGIERVEKYAPFIEPDLKSRASLLVLAIIASRLIFSTYEYLRNFIINGFRGKGDQ